LALPAPRPPKYRASGPANKAPVNMFLRFIALTLFRPPPRSALRPRASGGGPLLDPDELLLFKERRVVRVAPRAVEILLVLVQHRDRVVEKQELLNRVWGRPEANPEGVEEGNIARHIHDLRNVLGDTRQAARFIVNVHGRGYQFVAQVTERIVDKEPLGRAPKPIVGQPDEVASPGAGRPQPSDALPKAEVANERGGGQPQERPRSPDLDSGLESQVPTTTLETTASRHVEVPRVSAILSAVTLVALVILAITLWIGSCGLAIVMFCLSAIPVLLVYPQLRAKTCGRAFVAFFFLAAMAYIPSAWTMPEVAATVINMRTLGAALAYPFVTGLRFIPVFVLVLGYWVTLGMYDDAGFRRHRGLSMAYALLGLSFLFITCVAEIWAMRDYVIWSAALPGSWTILICDGVVLSANCLLLVVSYKAFDREAVTSYTGLFACCGLVYFVIAGPAVLIDHQNNLINRHYLDRRRPEAYVVSNPDAIRDLGRLGERGPNATIGPDLESLLRDPEFAQALRTKKFYKQNFDEPFQVSDKAVIFGYKIETRPQREPLFITIRFPQELAEALRFQLVETDQ